MTEMIATTSPFHDLLHREPAPVMRAIEDNPGARLAKWCDAHDHAWYGRAIHYLIIDVALSIFGCCFSSFKSDYEEALSKLKENRKIEERWPRLRNEMFQAQQEILNVVTSASGTRYDEIPSLNIGERMGSTGYLDFLNPTELSGPIMKGVDRFNRPFISLKVRHRENGALSVITLFQRYTDRPLWTQGTSACFSDGEPISADTFSTEEARQKVRALLSGQNPRFELARSLTQTNSPVLNEEVGTASTGAATIQKDGDVQRMEPTAAPETSEETASTGAATIQEDSDVQRMRPTTAPGISEETASTGAVTSQEDSDVQRMEPTTAPGISEKDINNVKEVRENPIPLKICELIGTSFFELPRLDLGERMGGTGRLDFLKPDDLLYNAMSGFDCRGRPFISLSNSRVKRLKSCSS